MSVHEYIRRYYETTGTVHTLEARRRTGSIAKRLAQSLREDLAMVSDPSVQDYANCIEIRVRLDSNAPPVEAGREVLRDYIAIRSRPWVQISLFLSWVGPFALVRVGTYSLDSAGGLLLNQVVGDEEILRVEEVCKSRLRSLGLQVLSEEELRQPVEVETELVKEKDGSLVLPPLTVGKCLFYPWWSGEEPLAKNAWNLTR